MVWRKRRAAFLQDKGEANKESLRLLVTQTADSHTPGLIAYSDDGEPVGWISIGPRENFPALENSRIWKRPDNEPVWSITCFVIRKGWQGRGLTVQLIEAACQWAESQGASIVEAYPTDPGDNKRQPGVFVWTGLAKAFQAAGFHEVVRRSPTKPLMRRHLSPSLQ